MDTEGIRAVAQDLEESRKDVHAATAGLSEADAQRRPGESRWSVLECVEHIVIVEERVLDRIACAQPVETPRIDHERESVLALQSATRTRRVEGPPVVHPTGRFANLASALEEFDALRARTIACAESRGDELYSLTAQHPLFGTLNGIELLRVISGHAHRHADQVREVREAIARTSPSTARTTSGER